MHKITFTLFLLMLAEIVPAQYQIGLIPRISPDRAVYQKIGYTTIDIKYGSPRVKNRTIWGRLVPYREVWRAGANNATTIEFNSAVLINNMPLDSGKYAFFVIPREQDKWTIIFNKIHKQWGAFKYDKKEDALRVDILPRRKNYSQEELTYTIQQVGAKYGSIFLNWEQMEIEIPFETNYLQKFEEEVESRASQQPEYIQWIVYLQGAEHLLQMNANLVLAIRWINQAEQIMDATSEWNKQFYPRDYIKGHLYWTKAKVFAENKLFEVAVEYAEKMKGLENTLFYDRKKEIESIDALVSKWKAQ